MNAIDDPTIPDDLGELLRRASSRTTVTPASLASVERRARQRRRRRHGIVASGAALSLVLGGLVVAQTMTGSDGPQRVITATTAAPRPTGSVPQPLLSRRAYGGEVSRELREVSASGAPLWWRAPSGWQAIEGVVLADGRRFGVAVGQPGTDQDGYRLSEIGPDGEAVHTVGLPIDVPDGWQARGNRLIGATGTEVIVAQETESKPPESPTTEYAIHTSTKVLALDVDSGATRVLVDGEPSGPSSAADDVLARSNGTDCTLLLQRLHGGGAARTVQGGCPPGIDGLQGMAMALAVSPDGRYVAAVWNEIRPAAQAGSELIVIDATDGTVVYRAAGDPEHLVRDLAWTADATLTAAIDVGSTPPPPGDGPVRVGAIEVTLDG